MKQEIETLTNQLKEAMIESVDALVSEDKAKLRKIKAHKNLLLAKDAIRGLTFN